MAILYYQGITTNSVTPQLINNITFARREYIESIIVNCGLSTYSITEANHGIIVIRYNSANKYRHRMLQTANKPNISTVIVPIKLFFKVGDNFAILLTPASSTSRFWTASYIGQEQ